MESDCKMFLLSINTIPVAFKILILNSGFDFINVFAVLIDV